MRNATEMKIQNSDAFGVGVDFCVYLLGCFIYLNGQL